MSPSQLIPSQPYTLTYYITDHTDNATYYVQAVVYDATTGEVLDTQNLTQQTTNSHLYSKRTQTPGDSSGHGRRIIVVATAYEDANHTVKSALYQQQSENFIVIKPNANGQTGGGGFGVDYRVIQEIFVEEFTKVVTSWVAVLKIVEAMEGAIEKIPTKIVNLGPVLLGLEEIRNKLSEPTEKVELEPVIAKIDEAIKAIVEKEVTEKTDIDPIITALADLKDEMCTNHGDAKDFMGGHMKDLSKNLPKIITDATTKVIEGTSVKLQLYPIETPEEEVKKPTFDIKSLTGQE